MLISSDDVRLAGYGVPPTEYTALYEQRDRMEPLPFSRWAFAATDGRSAACSTGLAVGLAAALLAADLLTWRVVAAMFDREGLVTGRRG